MNAWNKHYFNQTMKLLPRAEDLSAQAQAQAAAGFAQEARAGIGAVQESSRRRSRKYIKCWKTRACTNDCGFAFQRWNKDPQSSLQALLSFPAIPPGEILKSGGISLRVPIVFPCRFVSSTWWHPVVEGGDNRSYTSRGSRGIGWQGICSFF